MKPLLTTKHTKDTKVSDIDISKLLNFVLFVTFVVKSFFPFHMRLNRAGRLLGGASPQLFASHLPVIEMNLRRAEDLVILMAFARDQHRIARLRRVQGNANRRAAERCRHRHFR